MRTPCCRGCTRVRMGRMPYPRVRARRVPVVRAYVTDLSRSYARDGHVPLGVPATPVMANT